MRLRKGTLLGNMVAALYRMRRIPLTALSSHRADHLNGDSGVSTHAVGGTYQSVYVVTAGPGDWKPLRDTLDSILCYEGDRAKAIVVDDSSTDCRRSVVQAEFPQVDVIRRPWPSGGPPRNLAVVTDGIRFALRHYAFEVLIKLDTDALVTGSTLSTAAARFFEGHPRVGMAGTHRVRADGEPENYDWDSWVLRHSSRWSPAVRALMKRARAGGYDGAKVHGGVYALSRCALDAMSANGDFKWRAPWWTPLGEDFWISMMVLANGFALDSLGGPGEVLAVASKYTPIARQRVLSEGKLAIHSVRRGLDGEDEETMREFFREAREEAQTGSSRGVTTDSSGPPGR